MLFLMEEIQLLSLEKEFLKELEAKMKEIGEGTIANYIW